MKEEVRFKISGTKRRCILIKKLIDAVVPIIGWQIGNRNPIEIRPFNQNPKDENAIHQFTVIILI